MQQKWEPQHHHFTELPSVVVMSTVRFVTTVRCTQRSEMSKSIALVQKLDFETRWAFFSCQIAPYYTKSSIYFVAFGQLLRDKSCQNGKTTYALVVVFVIVVLVVLNTSKATLRGAKYLREKTKMRWFS